MNIQNSGFARARARLMVVDDHDLVRQGVVALVKAFPDWTLCGEAANGQQALELAAEARPDVVIVDISMSGTNGLDLIPQLRDIVPKVEVLVFSLHDNERIISQAVRAGARGYVLKSDEAKTLIEAIAAVSRHQRFFSPAIPETVRQFALQPARAESAEQLTARERQVVKLVAQGNSNKHIANKLKLSIKTVETHRSAVMRKISAKCSADIALYAARNGLVLV